MTMISQRTAIYALAFGLLIWFEATLTARWLGDYIFVPSDMSRTIMLFALTPAIVYAVGWFFFYTFQTPREARASAAILICAIGLVANAAVLGWIDMVLPDMDVAEGRLFASWVAWAYGIGLLSGLWPRHLARVPAT